MLKFLSKVVVEYCPLDPRKVAAVELLAQCNSRKAKDSNPSCSVELRRLPVPPPSAADPMSPPPRVIVTYPNGVEEAIVITEGDTAQGVRDQIIARGRLIDTELLFRNGGEEWPVVIPEEELRMPFPGIKFRSIFLLPLSLGIIGSCSSEAGTDSIGGSPTTVISSRRLGSGALGNGQDTLGSGLVPASPASERHRELRRLARYTVTVSTARTGLTDQNAPSLSSRLDATNAAHRTRAHIINARLVSCHNHTVGRKQSRVRGETHKTTTMGDITAAAAGDAPAPPQLTKENNLFMNIVVNPDGTVTRPEVPLVPPSSAAGGAASRDVPLDASAGTYLRLFLPDPIPPTPSKLPVVLYFHGGGFVILSAATAFYHAHCESMAAAVPCIVASLEYRLAPEHRLPAAYHDAAAAASWLRGGASQDPWLAAHADLSRCYLMGSSSGGNMAFFAGIQASKGGAAAVRGLMLHQPYLGGVDRTASEAGSEDDFMLPLEASDKLWSLALPEGADRDHEFCNPVKAMAPADLAGLPRCLVTGNRDDPLIDRQREFARWLQDKGGVEVVAKTDHTGFHACELFVLEKAQELFAAMREFMFADGA
nr:unnamed protein product [Digitaria exilis]CAB3483740.1 unnamed protein product [Digitaria exilis]